MYGEHLFGGYIFSSVAIIALENVTAKASGFFEPEITAAISSEIFLASSVRNGVISGVSNVFPSRYLVIFFG